MVPLAHLALAMVGEGNCFYKNKVMKRKDAMRLAGIKPLKLKAKEGLALINGTQVMTGIGVLALHDAVLLLKNAQIAGAMSIDALQGTEASFDDRISKIRAHKGQRAIARNLRKLLKGSEILESHKECVRVQDAYTLRCLPQVLGASKDALEYVRKILTIEMNSVTDNPSIFSGESISGGNFHGQPVALAMDFLCIAVAEIGNYAERRIARMLDKNLSCLPAFLAENEGLNSGFMAVQYTASSLVSENKILSHPASIDSIPTSANQEDHVSMGTISARKAVEIVNNVNYIIAIELLCACQALEYHRPLKSGKGVESAYTFIREHVKSLKRDRALYKDVERVAGLIKNALLVDRVERAIGKLY